MTSRERWEAVLARQQPDRVPMDYWGTAEAGEKLKRHLGIDDWDEVARTLHWDITLGVGGKYVGPPLAEDTDPWGIRHRTIHYGTGAYREVDQPPLADYATVGEIEANYTWPDPDWWDYSHLPDLVDKHPDRPVLGGNAGPFYVFTLIRGLEQSLIDLIEAPELAMYCMERITDIQTEEMTRIFETIPGRVLLSFFADDFGSQEALLFSRKMIVEMVFPHAKRAVDLIHQAGAYCIHHDDGAIRELIPDLIELGIDVLNPIQWRCKGMEREGLKRDFGDKLVFHGGVDNQQTLAFGTEEDVRREVRDNLRILGEGGGYILAPCHNIQAVSPPENVVAMYETGYEEGWR